MGDTIITPPPAEVLAPKVETPKAEPPTPATPAKRAVPSFRTRQEKQPAHAPRYDLSMTAHRHALRAAQYATLIRPLSKAAPTVKIRRNKNQKA